MKLLVIGYDRPRARYPFKRATVESEEPPAEVAKQHLRKWLDQGIVRVRVYEEGANGGMLASAGGEDL
jgi:hypothetical protein